MVAIAICRTTDAKVASELPHGRTEIAVKRPLDSCNPVTVLFGEALRTEHRAELVVNQSEAISPTTFRAWMMLAVEQGGIDASNISKNVAPSSGCGGTDRRHIEVAASPVDARIVCRDGHFAALSIPSRA